MLSPSNNLPACFFHFLVWKCYRKVGYKAGNTVTAKSCLYCVTLYWIQYLSYKKAMSPGRNNFIQNFKLFFFTFLYIASIEKQNLQIGKIGPTHPLYETFFKIQIMGIRIRCTVSSCKSCIMLEWWEDNLFNIVLTYSMREQFYPNHFLFNWRRVIF